MKPDFNLGQHFMTNEELVDRIVSYIPQEKIVLEIGPGKGALSKKLSSRAGKLYLIEKDSKFEKYLLGYEVKFENVLKTQLPKFDVIVSNLAFNIIEPLVMRLIREDFEGAYLTISLGTYRKLVRNNTKFPYIFHRFFKLEKLEDISKRDFEPRPKVDAVFIKLTPLKDRTFFKELLKMYDQKLKNALIETLKERRTKNEVRKMYSRLNIGTLDTRVRNLTLKELKDVEKMLDEEERNLR